MTVSEAKEIAVDFLGSRVNLHYYGVNDWPAFSEVNLLEDNHVFSYYYEDECRLGSDRYIGVAIIDSRATSFNNRCTIMDFGE